MSLVIVLAGAGVLNIGLALNIFEVDGNDGLGLIGVDDEVRAACSAFKLFLFCWDISNIFDIDAGESSNLCKVK